MTFRRLLILLHRYLGIAIGLMCVVWFASGIVMMYAGSMPRLSQDIRLERLPALDLSRVRLSPADAAERLAASDEREAEQQAADGHPAGQRHVRAWRHAVPVLEANGTPGEQAIVRASVNDRQPIPPIRGPPASRPRCSRKARR